MPLIELLIPEDCESGERLDLYLAENTLLSRSKIQALIKDGAILLNGQNTVSKYPIKGGERVTVDYEEETVSELEAENIPLKIIYEDQDLLVIDKPKGMVVHPAPGNYHGTLVNALLYHCQQLSEINGYFRPGIVHRIDKDTSGLLVCAKNDLTHQKLAEQLQDKRCFRRYYALVSGVIQNNEGLIDAPIGRSEKDRQKMCVTDKNAKNAISEFKVLDRMAEATLLDIELKTGRTHQIRVHMQYIKHPVLNDPKYGKKLFDESGQYLHAYYLSFIHPRTNERMEFRTEMPDYMKEYLKNNGCDDGKLL